MPRPEPHVAEQKVAGLSTLPLTGFVVPNRSSRRAAPKRCLVLRRIFPRPDLFTGRVLRSARRRNVAHTDHRDLVWVWSESQKKNGVGSPTQPKIRGEKELSNSSRNGTPGIAWLFSSANPCFVIGAGSRRPSVPPIRKCDGAGEPQGNFIYRPPRRNGQQRSKRHLPRRTPGRRPSGSTRTPPPGRRRTHTATSGGDPRHPHVPRRARGQGTPGGVGGGGRGRGRNRDHARSSARTGGAPPGERGAWGVGAGTAGTMRALAAAG